MQCSKKQPNALWGPVFRPGTNLITTHSHWGVKNSSLVLTNTGQCGPSACRDREGVDGGVRFNSLTYLIPRISRENVWNISHKKEEEGSWLQSKGSEEDFMWAIRWMACWEPIIEEVSQRKGRSSHMRICPLLLSRCTFSSNSSVLSSTMKLVAAGLVWSGSAYDNGNVPIAMR